MTEELEEKIMKRKNDHLQICLNEDVNFKTKTSGFEYYEFEHFAPTELIYNKIDLSTKFFGQDISYPFAISCMTGGTIESKNINTLLAIAARELNIPVGVGSQRIILEYPESSESFKVVKANAGNVPIMGNIGASQVSKFKDPAAMVQQLIDIIEATAMVIHLNPAQELFQSSGEPDFSGFLKNLERITKKINLPIIVKEVGSGISRKAAKVLLDVGVRGIDVAGAGGTSWVNVELQREKEENNYFGDWGLPTSYCIKEVKKLKKSQFFYLIASGGIKSGIEIAKSIALGADIAAAANPLIKAVADGGADGVIKLLLNWFETLKKVMYLINCGNIKELSKHKLISTGELY